MQDLQNKYYSLYCMEAQTERWKKSRHIGTYRHFTKDYF